MAGTEEDQIAIVGLWCRFPHADGPGELWRILVNGQDCMEEIPAERWNQNAWYSPDKDAPGKIYVERAGFVEGYKEFDPSLFALRDQEASRLDPQQRYILECSYKAFENAGITMEQLHGSDTGVFMGAMNCDYLVDGDADMTQVTNHSITGTSLSLLAARVSYTFNLTGPALTVDTACSSGMYALHLGCQAIRAGDCSMAVCGGVSFILRPNMFVSLCRAGMACPDGRCKPFSASANGYARGEGCGVLILKRLEKALEDKDHIWAIVRTGVNQDGRHTIPITAPSQTQQEELLRHMFEHYNIEPQDIDYIEAHGPGTPVGDPVEANSLGNVIGKARNVNDDPVLLGSVKGNIGHLESAAAMAGVIKVLLMMKHKKIVPNLHFDRPNPNIDFDSLHLYVPTAVLDWTLRGKDRRLACVNSFGFGGSNSHAILEQLLQNNNDSEEEEPQSYIVALSARKRESLKLSADDLINYLRHNPGMSVQRLSYTSTMKRTHHNYRLAVSGGSVGEIERSLTKALNSIKGIQRVNSVKRKSAANESTDTDKQVIFVFCGQGTLWKGMCLDLIDKEWVFRRKLTEIDSLLRQYVDWSLLEKLSEGEDFDVPSVAQSMIFASQVALFALWQSWGIRPDAILGHSVGEVAAAHCSGALSLSEAVRVIYHRGRLQNEATGGKMLVVGNLSIQKVEELCWNVSGELGVAVENSATFCTLSGDSNAIDEIHDQLKSMNENELLGQLFVRELGVNSAYHSSHMEPVREELQKSLANLTGQLKTVELYSTVTGERATPTDFVTGNYWGRNVRQPVMFRSAMSKALRPDKHNVVVEIGPKAPLRNYIKQTASGMTLTYVSSVKTNQEYSSVMQGLCDLFQAGLSPKWDSFFQGRKYIPSHVPRYQFSRKLLFFETEKAVARRQGLEARGGSTHPFLTQVSTSPPQFECVISKQKIPYLYDHVLDGTVVVPGAHYCDLGIASCMDAITPRQPIANCRTSVKFLTPVTLGSQEGTTVIKVVVTHDEDARKIHFEQRTDQAIHATGTVTYENRQQQTIDRLDIEDVRYRCNNEISHDNLYEALHAIGFQYGPTLCRLRECRYGDGTHGKEGIALIDVHDTVAAQMHSCCIHPAILDCLLQSVVLLGLDILRQANGRRINFLPVSIDSIVVARPVEDQMWAYVKQTRRSAGSSRCNGVLVGLDGQVILELRGLTIKNWMNVNPRTFNDLVYTTTWTVAQSHWNGEVGPQLVAEICRLKCLVLQDDCGIANQLEPFVNSDSVFISLEDFKAIDYKNDEHALPKMLKEIVSLDFDLVLHFCGISQLDPENVDTEILDSRVEVAWASLRQILKMLVTHGSTIPVKVITRNVQYAMWQESLDDDSAWHGLLDLVGAPLWGLVRCAIREGAYPLLQLVELSSGDNFEIYALLNELVTQELGSYTEIMCVQSAKYFLEIVKSPLHAESAMYRINNAEEECRLKIQTQDPMKPMNTIHAVYNHDRMECQTGHVSIKVQRFHVQPETMYAVTCEAQDGQVVYWPDDIDQGWDFLSLDFVGTIVQVPPKCKLRVGDGVVGVYPATVSSVVSLPVSVVHKLSDLPLLQDQPCLSYFVLAWEILVNLMNVKPKQSILLLEESTSAPSVAAKVIEAVASGLNATCYVGQKGKTLPSVKRDVAVVIGEVQKPLRVQLANVMAQNGQVVYLCCQTSNQNQQRTFSLRIRPDVRVLAVDTSTVFHETNLERIMPKVFKWLSATLTKVANIDLPLTETRLSSPSQTFGSQKRTTSRAKIAIVSSGGQSDDEEQGVPVICRRNALFRRDASYLVVGGLTGLGFLTVKFLAERGAGHIAIMSRSQAKDDTVVELQGLEEKLGSKITCLQADVTSYNSVVAALAELRDNLPGIPLKGVFHSAVVFSDGVLINQSHAQFKKGMDAKVAGTWNLHLATRHLKLDYFVGYSSMSSVFANGGQTSYGAANAFLDGFAYLRRQMNMNGQTINWGALELGIVERDTNVAKSLEQKGIRALSKDKIEECLEICLILNPAQLMVADLDLFRFRSILKGLPDFRRLEKLLGDIAGGATDDESLTSTVDLANLGQMNNEDRRKTLAALTRTVFVMLLNAEDESVHMNSSVVNMGMDSQLAVNAQNIFKTQFDVNVPVVALLGQDSTIKSINDLVYDQLNKVLGEAQPPVSHRGGPGELLDERQLNSPQRGDRGPQKFRLQRLVSVIGNVGDENIIPLDDFLGHVVSLYQLFERQVARTPDRTALITANGTVTYGQLNLTVQHIARVLMDLKPSSSATRKTAIRNVENMPMSTVSVTLIAALRFKSLIKRRYDCVGVSLASPEEAPAVILALWRAGYTFVPLCMTEEPKSLQHFVRRCDIQVIVTDDETKPTLLAKLGSFQGHIVTVPITQNDGDVDLFMNKRPLVPERKAFAMKDNQGNKQLIVSSHHYGLLNRLTWMWDKFPFKSDDVGCVTSPLTSVESLYETFVPLLVGTPVLVLPRTAMGDPNSLIAVLEEHHVTRMGGTQSDVWGSLVQILESKQVHNLRLTHLLCPVPAVDQSLVLRLQKWLPDVEVTTVLSSIPAYSAVLYGQNLIKKDENDDDSLSLNIVYKTSAYVLDWQGKPSGPGEQGELYIAAPGLLHTDRVVGGGIDDSAGGDDVVSTGLRAVMNDDGTIQLVAEPEQTIDGHTENGEVMSTTGPLTIPKGHEHLISTMRKGAPFNKRTTKFGEHRRYVRLLLDPDRPAEACIAWGPADRLHTGEVAIRDITAVHSENSTLVLETAKRTYYFKATEAGQLKTWTEGLRYLRTSAS